MTRDEWELLLDLDPADAQRRLEYADWLEDQGLAVEAEPTDAQLLWDRAQNLQQAGRKSEANTVLRKIADGDWQPRFSWLKSQARWQLEGR